MFTQPFADHFIHRTQNHSEERSRTGRGSSQPRPKLNSGAPNRWVFVCGGERYPLPSNTCGFPHRICASFPSSDAKKDQIQLLGSQCFSRTHRRGSARWEKTRSQRSRTQKQGHSGQRRYIPSLHAEQNLAHQHGRADCAYQPNTDTHGRQTPCLPHHELVDRAALRADSPSRSRQRLIAPARISPISIRYSIFAPFEMRHRSL